MRKKKFFPFGILVVLLVICVLFSLELFGCAPISSVGGNGSGAGISGLLGSGGSDTSPTSEQDSAPPAVSEWELPIIVSITGDEANAGLAAAWGFDYGAKAVNEMGGIRGVPVKITVFDVASSEEKVAGEIAAVADKAMAVIGPANATLFDAGAQEIENARLPVIGAASDAQMRENARPFAISCVDDPGSAAVAGVVTWMKAERFENLCVFYDPVSAGRTEEAKKAVMGAGRGITEAFQLGNSAFDAAGIVEKAIATGADAYYLDLNAEDTLRVVAQLKNQVGEDASKLKILCGPRAAGPETLEAADDMLGVTVWTTLDPTKDAEKRKAFNEAYEKNVGDPAWYDVAVDYYQAALLLKDAIGALELTGSSDARVGEREKLALYLYDSSLVSTDHGEFIIVAGEKKTEVKLYKVTEKGFQL